MLALVLAFALSTTALVTAQDKEKEKTPAPARVPIAGANVVPLKVQVVIGRYQGEKKISSMPYTLTMNANNHANLRMGTKIPVLSTSVQNAKDAPMMNSFQYQDIGTNIDCNSIALDDGRFLLSIS